MSEPIPESIPTSHDRISSRPAKKLRQLPPGSASASVAKTHTSMAPPPEIVTNVQGSSAGAGSGEFHVYKASRRREYERLRLMDEEAKREEDDADWAAKERERKERDEEQTRRNRERRNKKKNNRKQQKNGKGGGGDDGMEEEVREKQPSKLREVQRLADEDEGANGEHEVGGAVQQENGITIHDDD
ncbi:PRKR-interacting protein 1 [Cyphellophora attinorum]|uniref:PRKR-interacting protein 1 n=1 Tax=Cyphellophora attinorum TaxID=1664694 RepID=A0A0N1HA70_9EURO|nr:PRKR-interacting protein 1 [Phialophora attinorum]KPI40666.1 PRKR-interacting protein 1 [Phialophora attinorum]